MKQRVKAEGAERVRDRVRWRHVAVVVLFVGVVFGALVQAGVLMPKFRESGEGGSSGGLSQVYEKTIQNESLRSWTITAFKLPEGRTETLPDGSTVHVGGIYRGADVDRLFQSRPRALAPPLTIGPGQQFMVQLVRKLPRTCLKPVLSPSPAQIHRLESSHMPPPLHDIPAVIAISTPLGSRTFGTNFSVGIGCNGA